MTGLVSMEKMNGIIHEIRDQKVILDKDIARLYGIDTGDLIQAVKRNSERFPSDFMFQLTYQEVTALRSQIVISKKGRGGRRHLPYAFTEQGVAMLSSVVRSPQAVRVNIEIMRAFVKLRQLAITHADLARRVDDMERNYDSKFKIVFDAIRQMMVPANSKKIRIGFLKKG